MTTKLLTHLLGFVVQLGLLLAVVWLAKRGHYPMLAAPDPACAPTRGDAWRNRLSVALALGFGAFAGTGLALVPPPEASQQLARIAAYDDLFGPILGGFFFGLACAALVAYPLAERLVAPGPLQHFLWRSGGQWNQVWRRFTEGRVVDPRPLSKSTARIVLFAALLLHFSLREQHVTFTEAGVVWRDWPWQGETEIAWKDVTAVEVVATFEALSGKVVDVPTLRLQVRDGEPLTLGRFVQRRRDVWEQLGGLAAARAGVPLTEAPR
jgi:hypothetical protein